jgi:general secretion pathway protein M
MSFNSMLSTVDRTWRARLEPLARHSRVVWQQRTAREQRLLKGGALLLIAAVLWAASLRPALHKIQQAREQLPVLQAQASQLDAIILEAKALGRGRSGGLSAAETELALQASLRSMGLDAVSALSRSEGPTVREAQWQIQFASAPAGRIMEWMVNLPFVAQLQTRQVDLARSNVDGRDRPGLLSGVIVLALAPQERK